MATYNLSQKRKTPRVDRNARFLLLALFQIKEEEGGGDFSKDLNRAMERIKGIPKSQLLYVIGQMVSDADPNDKGRIFLVSNTK